MTQRRNVAAWCAVAALATSFAAAAAQMAPHGFRPSALVRMSADEPMAQLARASDPGFVFYPISSHYDGVYFYAVARDPFATGVAHTLIDKGAYRYGHAGFGWLAWLASLGQASALPAVMLLLALACSAGAAACASMLAKEMGLSPWWGLAVALNPGLLYSVTVVCSEAAGLFALLGGLLLWRRGRLRWAVAAFTAMCLIKEPFVLVPVGIAIFEVVRWLRATGDRPPAGPLIKRVATLAVGPAIFTVWYVYVWRRFGALPAAQSKELTAFPFAGWVDSFRRAAATGNASFDLAQIGAVTIPLLVAVGSALVIGSALAFGMRSELDPVFILLAFVAFSLNWLELLYPKDFLRVLTMQLALMPFVFLPRRQPVPLSS